MASLGRSPSFAQPYPGLAVFSGARPKVLIVDDDSEVWDPLARVLDAANMEVEISPIVPGFLLSGRPETPTCLIINVQSTGPDALDFQQELAAANVFVPIIFVTGCGDIPTTVRAMKNGAIDFLSKPFRDHDLFASVQFALALDRAWCDRQSEMAAIRVRFETLSAREREVMAQVVKGRLNKQVGGDLGISEITVKAHRGKVMRKMTARSLPDLIQMAGKIGLNPLLSELPLPRRDQALRDVCGKQWLVAADRPA
jgi:FixJ family two-component response regulator